MRIFYIKVFLEHLSLGLIIPIATIWMLQKGLTLTEVGFLASLVFISQLVLEIPTGIIADKFNTKTSIVLGILLNAIGLGITAYSSTFYHFAIAAIFTGSAWACLSGAEETYMFESAKKDVSITYKQALSRMSIFDEVSTVLGMFTSSLLIVLFGMQFVFINASILMFVAFLVVFVLLPNLKSTSAHHVLFQSDQTTSNYQNIKGFLKRNTPSLFLMFAFAVMYESGRLLWQPQLLSIGFKIGQLGVIYGILKIITILGTFLDNRVTLSTRVSLLYGSVTLPIVFVLFGLPFKMLSLLGLAIYFFLETPLRIYQSDYLNNLAPPNMRTTFLSTNSFVRNGFSALFSVPLGIIGQSSLLFGFGLLAILKLFASIYYAFYTIKSSR